jgi:uncharacterized protein (TIGR00288 family)
MPSDEERIALFIDYENLAIGAEEEGLKFDLKPIADALAERGRTVVRRAYADWSRFSEDRRMLARHHVEMIEIPQRLGVRKNAADIKLVVDALELSFERDYVSTYVICTGDSDFSPLVQKLRELNRRVIGIGLEDSTSSLLPPACDEFLFYEDLEGVDVPKRRRRGGGRAAVAPSGRTADRTEPAEASERARPEARSETELGALVAQTLAGLKRSGDGEVTASQLKRAIIRKEPTFTEADHGFRGFGELLKHLEDRKVVELSEGPARGDPEVDFPTEGGEVEQAFELLRAVVSEIGERGDRALLTSLKPELRRQQSSFNEREYGFGGFLQFCRAARTRGYVELAYDEAAQDYVLSAPSMSLPSGATRPRQPRR